MDADTGNHHDPTSYSLYVSNLPDSKINVDRGFIRPLMMRLVRWILLVLIHVHVESLYKISAEYISAAPIVFSVFWASRNGYGSFQMDFAVYT